LEVSLLWFTEGKGDEDLTVHYFHRWSALRLQSIDLTSPQYFETRLPESPLSYNGRLFRIRWCARMRLFLGVDSEIVAQQAFTLEAAGRSALQPVSEVDGSQTDGKISNAAEAPNHRLSNSDADGVTPRSWRFRRARAH
jgi:hypothetical protein